MIPIVVVTHNCKSVTEVFVQAVLKHTKVPFYWVFVDNGSTDETREYLRSIPNSILLPLKDNYGAAVARTLGIALCNEDFICVLDNDLLPETHGWLKKLYEVLTSNPWFGMVAGIDQTEKELLELDGPQKVEHIPGSGLMRRQMFLELAGYDYQHLPAPIAEDTDFCFRGRRVGWRFMRVTSVRFHHLGKKESNEELGVTRGSQQRFSPDQIEKQRQYFWQRWTNPSLGLIILCGDENISEVADKCKRLSEYFNNAICVCQDSVYTFLPKSHMKIENLGAVNYGIKTMIATTLTNCDAVIVTCAGFFDQITQKNAEFFKKSLIDENQCGFWTMRTGVDFGLVAFWSWLLPLATQDLYSANEMQDVLEMLHFTLSKYARRIIKENNCYILPWTKISTDSFRQMHVLMSQQPAQLYEKILEISKAFDVDFYDWRDLVTSSRRSLESFIETSYPFLDPSTIDYGFYMSGFANLNLLVQGKDKARYVLRLCGPHNKGDYQLERQQEDVEKEYRLLTFLNENDFLSPNAFPASEGVTTPALQVHHRNFYAILMEYIDGEPLNSEQLNDDLLSRVAQTTAKLHCALCSNWKSYSKQGDSPHDWLKEYLNWTNESRDRIYKLSPQNVEAAMLDDTIKEVEEACNQFKNSNSGVMTLLHGDLAPANILLRGGEVFLIDFGDYRIDLNFYDLSVLLFNIDRVSRSGASFLVEHYDAEVNRLGMKNLCIGDFLLVLLPSRVRKLAQDLYYMANDLEEGRLEKLGDIHELWESSGR